jgi:hypothetical protein
MNEQFRIEGMRGSRRSEKQQKRNARDWKGSYDVFSVLYALRMISMYNNT